MELSVAQLCFLRSTLKSGLPYELLDIFLDRCNMTRQEFGFLSENKFIDKNQDRINITKEGKKVYSKLKVGRYF